MLEEPSNLCRFDFLSHCKIKHISFYYKRFDIQLLTSLELVSWKNWSEEMALALPNFFCASSPEAEEVGSLDCLELVLLVGDVLLWGDDALLGSWSVQPLLLPPDLSLLPLSNEPQFIDLDSLAWFPPLYIEKPDWKSSKKSDSIELEPRELVGTAGFLSTTPSCSIVFISLIAEWLMPLENKHSLEQISGDDYF